MGALFARFGGPEVTGSQQVGNPRARLMTLAEFEDRFAGHQSSGDRSRPVWVVTVEVEWSGAGIVPPDKRRKYSYGDTVIDAQTGESISGGMRFDPIKLEEAEGLDPASFPTYPLDVPLSYAKELVRFPVSEPT
ncbi:MAG: hypothetical protein Q8N53_15465, partial [Longimicrobiales bacterium]|nr:hypothetical protein [Longimicrobiales bacterium]